MWGVIFELLVFGYYAFVHNTIQQVCNNCCFFTWHKSNVYLTTFDEKFSVSKLYWNCVSICRIINDHLKTFRAVLEQRNSFKSKDYIVRANKYLWLLLLCID